MGGQMAFRGFLAAFFCLVSTPLQTSNNGVKWGFWSCRLFVFRRRVGEGSSEAANVEKYSLSGV